MGTYSTQLRICPYLPDGKLVVVRFTPGHVRMDYLKGHLAAPLARDLGELFRHIAQSGVLTLEPERALELPEWDVWYQRVPIEFLPLRTFVLRRGARQGRHCFAFKVREDMMSAALTDEINDFIVPATMGAMRYARGGIPAPRSDLIGDVQTTL